MSNINPVGTPVIDSNVDSDDIVGAPLQTNALSNAVHPENTVSDDIRDEDFLAEMSPLASTNPDDNHNNSAEPVAAAVIGSTDEFGGNNIPNTATEVTSIEELLSSVEALISSGETNDQSYVVPLVDPIKVRTADSQDDNPALLALVVEDPSESELNGEMLNYIENAASISNEGFTPILGGNIRLSDLLSDNKYLDNLLVSCEDKNLELDELRARILDQGGVDRTTAERLEQIHPNMLAKRVSLESFSIYPSRNNYEVSLEVIDTIQMAVGAVAAIGAFGLIYKAIMWMREKVFSMSKVTTDTEASIAKILENTVSKINAIQTNFPDRLEFGPIKERLNNMIKSKVPQGKIDTNNLLSSNDVLLNQVLFDNYRGKLSQLNLRMITDSGPMETVEQLNTLILATLPDIHSQVNMFESKLKSSEILDVKDYTTEFKDTSDLFSKMKYKQGEGKAHAISTAFLDRTRILSTPDKSAKVPTFTAARATKFDIDQAHVVDKKIDDQLKSLLPAINKIQKECETITDNALKANRNAIAANLRESIMTLNNYSAALESIRRAMKIHITVCKDTVVTVDQLWGKGFKGTGITY